MLLVLIFRLPFILLQDEQSGTRRTRLLRILQMSKKFAQMSKCPFSARHRCEGWKNFQPDDNKDIKLKQNYEIRITRSRNTGTGRTPQRSSFSSRRQSLRRGAPGGRHFYRWRGAGIVGGRDDRFNSRRKTAGTRRPPYPETKEFLAGLTIIDVPN